MALETAAGCLHTSQHYFGCDLKKDVSKKESKFDLFMRTMEKVSAAALGAFSTYVNWKLFVPYFFVGISIGVYSYIQDEKSCQHSHSPASCAHGLLEQLTGVKLPAPIALAANVAVAYCHIDHHSSVFVPIVALSCGAWIGKVVSHLLRVNNVS